MKTPRLTVDELEAQTGINFSCSRCAGHGLDPSAQNIQPDWIPILRRLHDAGVRRAETRSGGSVEIVQRHNLAWREILTIWETEAQPRGMTKEMLAIATGLSRMSLYEGLKNYGWLRELP
jgi:hypothetical protein